MTPPKQHSYPEAVKCPLLCEGQPRFLRLVGSRRSYECDRCSLVFDVPPIVPKRRNATKNAPVLAADPRNRDSGNAIASSDQRRLPPMPPKRGGSSS
jgi:hypothetical protein